MFPQARTIRILLLTAAMAFTGIGAGLEEGFRTPPSEARLRCYWWWLNGNVTAQSITRDLEQMKAKGFGGAIIVDAGGANQRGHANVPAGPMFGSPQWRELYKHAISEAGRLGLELSLNILSGWDLGGPTVKPENAAKLAAWSKAAVTGPARVERVLETPKSNAGYYRDVAVLAYPLKHGVNPSREPIRMLDLKSSAREFGMSTPDTRPLLSDAPAKPGEEDTEARQVIDLTSKMDASGKLTWDAPAGEWEILRFGYAASGARVSTSSDTWQGLAIDYLDRKAFESYWNDVLAPLVTGAGPALKYLVTDSWELGGVNWSPNFREEFKQRRGYDPMPWVPAMTGRIVDSREMTTRFLNDLRRTVGDLIADRHYAVFDELARKHGLGIHPESGGPHGAPIDSLRNLGIGAFPQMEFWAKAKTHRIKDEERFFLKEASSAAHIYGKTIVAAEGFTSIGPQWEETLWDNLKPTFDRAVCEGLNLLIWHTVTSSPKEAGVPGQEYFAGTHFNPNVTWWEQSGAFLTYLNRVHFLAQQGKFVADVLYYYGDHVPNFVRLKADDPARVLPGYDYDAADFNTLINRVTVRDGRLTLPDGMSYRMLALPDIDGISPAALKKIRQLVLDGATVVGRRPLRSNTLAGYPQSEQEVQQIAAEMWGPEGVASGKRTFGKGAVIWGMTAREALATEGVRPDFEFVSGRKGASIDYIHRRTGEGDIYFISNQSGRSEIIEATFRVAGKLPEVWQPVTGEMRPQAIYESANGRTSVALRLEPYGSVFVIFRKPEGPHFIRAGKDGVSFVPITEDHGGTTFVEATPGREGRIVLTAAEPGEYSLQDAAGHTTSVSIAPSQPLAIEGPWTVRFTKGWGAPEIATFDALRSWTENPDEGIKYFSGTAVYEKDVEISASMLRGGPLVLDLGDVREIASVRVNGTDLGVVWSVPRTVNISTAVRPGKNRLEITVTNLWPNRIIGDQFLPEDKRFTRTNIRKFTKDSPLLPSGLLGPVALKNSLRSVLPALAAGGAGTQAMQHAGAREGLSLDGAWQTIIDPYENGYYDYRYRPMADGGLGANKRPTSKSDHVEFDFEASPLLSVPGDWNTQRPELFLYEGTIWYKRDFDYTLKPGRRLFLWFGAANYHAIVFLNGKRLGEHTGGFTPFQFEITSLVKERGNFVIVKVDDQRKLDAIPTVNTDWWNYGGITRSVRLLDVPETYVEDYVVQLEKGSPGRVGGWVKLAGPQRRQKITVRIPEAGIVKETDAGEDGIAKFSFDAKLDLWSPGKPRLYDVVVETASDRVQDRIGFRTIETRGRDILLNGKPVFLRGAAIHAEAPYRQGRVFNEGDARTLLTWAKELNCNFVRLAHYPHDEVMTRLADEMGLLVWAEIPVYWTIQWENPATYANAERQLTEMITRDHNRASVILWSVSNETPRGEPRLRFLSSLAKKTKELDPTRLVSAALETHYTDPNTIAVDDPLSDYLDVIGCNEYIGWYDGAMDKPDRISWTMEYDKPLIMTEFGAEALAGHHGDDDEAWTEENQAKFYRHQIGMLKRIPFLRGTVCWVLVDFRSPRRQLARIQDFFNRKGLYSERGQKKAAFYVFRDFYRSLEEKEAPSSTQQSGR